jgi:hypothetical protein
VDCVRDGSSRVSGAKRAAIAKLDEREEAYPAGMFRSKWPASPHAGGATSALAILTIFAIVSTACQIPLAVSPAPIATTSLRLIAVRECELVAKLPAIESSLSTLQTAMAAGNTAIATREVNSLRAMLKVSDISVSGPRDLDQELLSLAVAFDAIAAAGTDTIASKIASAVAEVQLIKAELTKLAGQGLGCP